jgi:hypothetical protein
MMSRVILEEPELRPLSPGVAVDRVKPGGKDGPDGLVLGPCPGGQAWMSVWKLGSEDEPFQLAVPDIRMPANQLWPLHWHDCWVAVVVVEGSCIVGDWLMGPGDVLIAQAGLEYGPMLIGPHGCQMFEVFAQFHLRNGGYAPEYQDHPTLAGQPFQFRERLPHNRHNIGRQVMPVDGVEGLLKGRVAPGATFDLGDSHDPDRGVMLCTGLQPGEMVAAHTCGDARMFIVLDGEVDVGGRVLGQGECLIAERDAQVAAIRAGQDGALLLELVRTTAGLERRPA